MSSNLFAKLSFANQHAILLLNIPFAAEEHVFEMVNKTRIDRIPIPGEHYEFVLAFVHSTSELATYKEYFDNHCEPKDIVWMVLKQDDINRVKRDELLGQKVMLQNPIPILDGWKAFAMHSLEDTANKLSFQHNIAS